MNINRLNPLLNLTCFNLTPDGSDFKRLCFNIIGIRIMQKILIASGDNCLEIVAKNCFSKRALLNEHNDQFFHGELTNVS